MPNPVPYRVVSVEQHTETPTLTRKERSSARSKAWADFGCVGWIAAFVGSCTLTLIGTETGIVDDDDPAVLMSLILLTLGICLLVIQLIYWFGVRQCLDTKLKASQAEMDRDTQEAEDLTQAAANHRESSISLDGQLPTFLNTASHALERAEREYNDNAFAPFWDAMEEAAYDLGSFHAGVQNLTAQVQSYYGVLKARTHTFPKLDFQPDALPDPKPTMEYFSRLVRMGQTNFQFAMIWEQRSTRDVLIAGFQTLGAAIDNLASVVDYGMRELHEGLSSQLVRLVEEEIETRDALLREQAATRETIEDLPDRLRRDRLIDRK